MKNWIPSPYKTESISIRIELEKLALLDHLANQYQTSRSKLINCCIDYAIGLPTTAQLLNDIIVRIQKQEENQKKEPPA